MCMSVLFLYFLALLRVPRAPKEPIDQVTDHPEKISSGDVTRQVGRSVAVHSGSQGSGKKRQKVLHKLNCSFPTGPPSFGSLKGSQRRHEVGKQGGAKACIGVAAGKLMVPPAL